jgi:puromycin-sensitive aminopeptidase
LAYDLHLQPDLDAGTFRGSVRITVRLARARREITLHAADLTIEHASVHVRTAQIAARASVSRADETLTLRVPRRLPTGEATLVLSWSGKLNEHLRGLYSVVADERRYAFTQCEAADARRILPCFDEPSFKARFRVAVTARDGDAVVSNAPVEREEPVRGGRIVHFAETPPLSTYLLAVAVGPLEASAERRSASGTSRTRAT